MLILTDKHLLSFVLNINSGFSELNSFVDDYNANLVEGQKKIKASEIIFKLLNMFKVKCPVEVANYLLAGIYLDTKNFSLKTGTCTFEASAYLRNMGASTVNVKLMFQTDVDTYRLKAAAQSNLCVAW